MIAACGGGGGEEDGGGVRIPVPERLPNPGAELPVSITGGTMPPADPPLLDARDSSQFPLFITGKNGDLQTCPSRVNRKFFSESIKRYISDLTFSTESRSGPGQRINSLRSLSTITHGRYGGPPRKGHRRRQCGQRHIKTLSVQRTPTNLTRTVYIARFWQCASGYTYRPRRRPRNGQGYHLCSAIAECRIAA